MNIKEAKEQIQNAIRAYFTKDEYGNFCLPIHAPEGSDAERYAKQNNIPFVAI